METPLSSVEIFGLCLLFTLTYFVGVLPVHEEVYVHIARGIFLVFAFAVQQLLNVILLSILC